MRLHLQRFPAYAPEFNPDEGVWKLAKQRLANGQAHDLPELMVAVIESLEAVRANRRNLRGCITRSALPPVLALTVPLFMQFSLNHRWRRVHRSKSRAPCRNLLIVTVSVSTRHIGR